MAFLTGAVSDQALRWSLLLPLALAACRAHMPHHVDTPAESLGRAHLTPPPGEVVEQGGAAIDIASDRLTFRMVETQNGRAWTQPLYEKRPKQPKPPKSANQPKPEPPSEPAASGEAQVQ